MSRLTFPLSAWAVVIDRSLRWLTGRSAAQGDEESFEEEIRTIVTEGHREGLLEEEAREMIEGVIELGDVAVSHIMTPRTEMHMLQAQQPWDEVLEYVTSVGHTRLPVYDKSRDDIVGILYIKDLLPELAKASEDARRPLAEIVRKPLFVPESKAVDDLLQLFQHSRTHIAIVLDEYGGVSGLVTIEDVLEEIVGEIEDEFDPEVEEDIRKIDDGYVRGAWPGARRSDQRADGLRAAGGRFVRHDRRIRVRQVRPRADGGRIDHLERRGAGDGAGSIAAARRPRAAGAGAEGSGGDGVGLAAIADSGLSAVSFRAWLLARLPALDATSVLRVLFAAFCSWQGNFCAQALPASSYRKRSLRLGYFSMTRTATGPRVLGDRAWSRALFVGIAFVASCGSGTSSLLAQEPSGPSFAPPPLPATASPTPAPASVAPSIVAAEPEPASSHWPWSGWIGGGDPVGSPKWWKKHKKQAEFHVGKGYKVEGVDGYFDGMGRPIDRAVTEVSGPPPDSDVDPEKGLAPALDPRAVYGKMKIGSRARAERSGRSRDVHGGRAAVRRPEIPCGRG